MSLGWDELSPKRRLVMKYLMSVAPAPERVWACRKCDWRYTRRVVLLDWEETMIAFHDLYEHAMTHVEHH